jgi:hypothetical protein
MFRTQDCPIDSMHQQHQCGAYSGQELANGGRDGPPRRRPPGHETGGKTTGSAETPQRVRQLAFGSAGRNAPHCRAALGGMRRTAGHMLVARTAVRDLLLRAKHLFVGANGAWGPVGDDGGEVLRRPDADPRAVLGAERSALYGRTPGACSTGARWLPGRNRRVRTRRKQTYERRTHEPLL